VGSANMHSRTDAFPLTVWSDCGEPIPLVLMASARLSAAQADFGANCESRDKAQIPKQFPAELKRVGSTLRIGRDKTTAPANASDPAVCCSYIGGRPASGALAERSVTGF